VFHDLRYALRMLRGSPGFSLAAILCLALGIGANTAIFSLVDAVLLKMLPVTKPEELVALGAMYDPSKFGNFTHPEFEELRKRNHSLAGLLASCDFGSQNVRIDGKPELLGYAEIVSGNYFSVLGVKPLFGRTITEDDDRTPGAHPVIVISYGYWKSKFGSDPAVLGRIIQMRGTSFVIIGVAPSEFFGISVGHATAAWVPLMMQGQVTPGSVYLNDQHSTWLELIARRKPGSSEQQVHAELSVLFPQIRKELIGTTRKWIPGENQIQVRSGSKGLEELRRRFSRPLQILMGAVGLVLLIACANVANLLLARATRRQREIAVRLAIGAGRVRLIRQLLTESVLLAAAGSVLGVCFAWWSGSVLVRMVSGGHQQIQLDLQPDLRVMTFAAAICLLTTILFGLAPAFRATRLNVNDALKDSAGAVGRSHRFGLGRVLIAVQIALSVLLVAGAGLFVRTLQNLKSVDLGFQRDNVLMVRFSPRMAGYQIEQLPGLYTRIADRLNALPCVRVASVAWAGFGWGNSTTCCITVQGYAHRSDEDRAIRTERAGPGFFEAMGVPILLGRGFSIRDAGNAPKVAIINETVARFYFPNENPLGKRFGWVDSKGPQVYEIVGVVRDSKYNQLREQTSRLVYFPALQDTTYLSTIVVRSMGSPSQMSSAVRRELATIDSNLEIGDIATLAQLVDDNMIQERLVARLSGFFGLLALGLASLGLYGLMSYMVARRAGEIGIRMAFGAQQRNVLWLVMREVVALAVAGVALGIPAALATTRIAASMLYGLTAADPWVMSTAPAMMIAVALAAGYLPAQRAAQVDPMVALRHE
jgi:predicted permease